MKVIKQKQSNLQLINICKQLNIPLNGVFMKDELSGKIICLSNGNYILYLENSNQSGSHWVVLIKKNNKYIYCDSFGAPPPQTLIDNLKIDSNNLYFNNAQIQNVSSTLCSYFAIYFLLCMQQEKSIKHEIKKYLKTFDLEKSENNDNILINIFSNI